MSANAADRPPFQFAVVAEPDHDGRQWAETVRRCEVLGYDALLVTDHLFLRLSAVPALALAAGLTSRIRLGSYVLNCDLRDPVLLAKEMATVHTLSGGRAIVGLGAGWLRDDYTRAGATLQPGSARFERLRAAVPTVSKLLADAAAVDGRPAPDLLLGGARRRTLELAGRVADVVSVLPPLGPQGPTGYAGMTAGQVDEQVRWVRTAAAGRTTPPRLNHLLWECHVTSDPKPVVETLARRFGCEPTVVPELVPFLVGTVDDIAHELLARRDRWGFSIITVPARDATSFVPVMRMLRAEPPVTPADPG